MQRDLASKSGLGVVPLGHAEFEFRNRLWA